MITNIELAILGLAAEQPKYGYQIESDISQRGMREWTDIGFSSIYFVLNKMEKSNLLSSEKQISMNRPARKVYQLTPEGVEEYHKAILDRLSNPRPRTDDFDLALANLCILSPQETLIALLYYQDHLKKRIIAVKTKWDEDKKNNIPAHVSLLFDHGLTMLRAEADWVEKLIKSLKETQIMSKIDHKTLFKQLYSPSAKDPAIVEVPAMNYIMLDGKGDPNTSLEYQDTISALFGLAYAIKFTIKKSEGVDYAVMPLEGLWWVEDMNLFSVENKGDWLWTMMIMQPEFISRELFKSQRIEAAKKKNLPLLSKIRFEKYLEGTSVQLMHIGPYAAEGPNIARMHAYAKEQGFEISGKHHEIYLSDVRKAAPEKLKTVLRQPIKKM